MLKHLTKDLIAVGLPAEANSIMIGAHKDVLMYYNGEWQQINLPPKTQWEILTDDAVSCNEYLADTLVEGCYVRTLKPGMITTANVKPNNRFKNYMEPFSSNPDECFFKTAKESLASLLQSSGCLTVNPLPKPDGEDYYSEVRLGFDETDLVWNKELYEADVKKWQQAQQSVFPKWVILKKQKK